MSALRYPATAEEIKEFFARKLKEALAADPKSPDIYDKAQVPEVMDLRKECPLYFQNIDDD